MSDQALGEQPAVELPLASALGKEIEQAEVRLRIAKRLKELMKRYDVSVRALSKSAQVSRNTVIAALNGQKSYPSTLAKLFNALEAPNQVLDDLLKPRLSNEDLEIALAYHEATTDVRDTVARILKTRQFRSADLRQDTVSMAYDFERCTLKEQQVIKMIIRQYLDWDATSISQEPDILTSSSSDKLR